MQLFLPSLLSILLIALFAFAVIPQFGPVSLGIVSLVALVGTIAHHAYMFKDEYAASTWQTMIGAYAGYITLGVAILVAIFFLLQMKSYVLGGSSPNAGSNAANAGILAGAVGTIGAAVSSITGPPAASAPGEPETLLEKATNAVQQSFAAMPNLKEAAQQITNPLVGAVNKGLNMVTGNTKPAAPALPFSPSEA